LRKGDCCEQRAPFRSRSGFQRAAERKTPFTTRTGRRLLYMWNPTTGEHAYYDVTNDVFLSADEATAALAMH
jgi:hypothetical protein